MPLTKGQELALIIQSLCQWQAQHVRPGNDQDLRVDDIVSLLDDLAQDVEMSEGE